MFFKRFAACCVIVLMATSAFYLFPEPAKTSLEQLPFLDESVLLLLILIASYFGYSRLFFIGLMFIVPATLPLLLAYIPELSPWLKTENLTLSIIAGTTWLLWQSDKGFRIKNIVSVIAQIAVAITLIILIKQYLLPSSINLSSIVLRLGIEQTLLLTNHTLLLVGLFIISSVRSLLRPSTVHVSLLTAMITLAILPNVALLVDPPLITGVYAILGLLLIVGLLIESRQMAFRDQLTEIPSRMALQQYIGTLGSRYVVVMADIDHFKKFNDTHGHDIGDQVLKLVAKKIASVNGGGKAFRYGGEEFTIIFADKEAHQIVPFVEQVRASIENYPLILRSKDRPKKKPPQKNKSNAKKLKTEKKVYVTSSFGVAESQHKSQTFEHVMKQADNALYQAKKAGRNCVKTA